ncbi:unnamed protein product [Macrosiphum euphorbiae]|uniref:BED-type domain-containing protein n=1 Tax=Macrosiphum euphorbiae TaxID=13131 RepID=A0AAV0VGZ7_9HEMI|nr:unnamed protein product [Macrosiphum euphorbiae]
MELDGESEIRELRLPWPVYNNLFKLISVNDNNFEVKCKLCVNSKMYSTSTKSNSNLKKHITSKHASRVKELEADLKIEKSTNKRKNNEFDCDQSAKVQQTISDAFSRAQPVSQENLNSMITEFVIMGNHAFNIVEEEKFKIIIQKGFPNRQCLSRKTLMSKISTTADNLKANLKAQLSTTEVKYVCATADCWSVFKRSYIGITVHWYDPESFQRLSAALACRRIKGRHTFDVLAKIMHDVIYEYGIFNKIIKIVTDNGSNFIKAFRVYSESENVDENMEMEEEQEVELIAISDILNEQTSFDADSPYSLPPHHRCASHTLNLVATKDSEKALSDPLYKKQLRSTFAKMRALWNKQERTSLIADTIHDELNIYIIVPNATRWNSTFQAVKCLKDQLIKSESEVQRICDKAGLPRFDKKDQAFMIDYCKVIFNSV